jgi:hypothetical protein
MDIGPSAYLLFACSPLIDQNSLARQVQRFGNQGADEYVAKPAGF